MEAAASSWASTSGSTLPARNSDYLDPAYCVVPDVYYYTGAEQRQNGIMTAHVLVVGCGNSRVSAEMTDAGYADVTSTDLSPVVIRRMREKHRHTHPGKGAHASYRLKWHVADMLDLPFGDATFDVVIEKGAMDVLFVDNRSPWDPSAAVLERVDRMLSSIHRVLAPDGVFVSITFAQPHFRKPLFLRKRAHEEGGHGWSVRWDTFGEGLQYFFYYLRKETDGGDQNGVLKMTSYTHAESLEHAYMDNEDYLGHIMVDDGG
eukprot:jgi/Chlat1/1134/Chrsp111S08644